MLAIASLLSGKSHGEAGPESHHDRGMLPVTLAFGFGRGKYYSAWRCCKAKTSCKGLTAAEVPTSVPRGTDWRFAFSILSRSCIRFDHLPSHASKGSIFSWPRSVCSRHVSA